MDFEKETGYLFADMKPNNLNFAVHSLVDRFDQKSVFVVGNKVPVDNMASNYNSAIEFDMGFVDFGCRLAADFFVDESAELGTLFAPSIRAEQNNLVLVYQTWANISSLSFSITHYEGRRYLVILRTGLSMSN
jgi:hypothetical protein